MRLPIHAPLMGLTLALGLGAGCVSSTPQTDLALPGSGAQALAGQAKCAVAISQSKPLVVEWPGVERGSLEGRMRQGVAVVRYAGCEMEVMTACRVPEVGYDYVGFTRKTDALTMRTADELWAEMPIGAERLEGELVRASSLTVNMTLVGMYSAERLDVTRQDLEGDCQGATHIVGVAQVGAYELIARAEARDADADTTLSQDGSIAACEQSADNDAAPPAGCGALLRLEVVELSSGTSLSDDCPRGYEWNGEACAPPVMHGCPEGHVMRDEACVPVSDRQSGTEASRDLSRMAFVKGGDRTETGKSVPKVDDFYLDVTEVTVADYQACVDASRCEAADTDTSCNAGDESRSDHPINCVSLSDADRFCRWAGKRVPRPEELRWASGGGARDWLYPWGASGSPASRVCWKRGSGEGTCRVGAHTQSASPDGVQDLIGNVAEWSHDGSKRRIQRIWGGSWNSISTADVQASAGHELDATTRSADVGFRCAADL